MIVSCPRPERDRDACAQARRRAILDPGKLPRTPPATTRSTGWNLHWLPLQGIVPESDDGVIIARGHLAGQPALVMAIEGAFQEEAAWARFPPAKIAAAP